MDHCPEMPGCDPEMVAEKGRRNVGRYRTGTWIVQDRALSYGPSGQVPLLEVVLLPHVGLVAIGSNVQNIRRSRILLAGLSGFFHYLDALAHPDRQKSTNGFWFVMRILPDQSQVMDLL